MKRSRCAVCNRRKPLRRLWRWQLGWWGPSVVTCLNRDSCRRALDVGLDASWRRVLGDHCLAAKMRGAP